MSRVRRRLRGLEDVETGKGREVGDDWLNLKDDKLDTYWWRVWSVNSDCSEIGEMECFGGFTLYP